MDSNPMPFIYIVTGLTVGLSLFLFQSDKDKIKNNVVAEVVQPTVPIQTEKPMLVRRVGVAAVVNAFPMGNNMSNELSNIPPAISGPVVIYSDSGFAPAKLEVKAGSQINFVNRSSSAMQIIFEKIDDKYKNSNWNQATSIGRDKIWSTMLNDSGEFIFFNKNRGNYSGTIVVR